MSILPFGCMAYAVKPVGGFLKSTLEARAWTGYNLGRTNHTPGAYSIWLPNLQKVVCTSEVYFDEGLMPWRPKGDRRIGSPLPSAPPEGSDSLDATVRGVATTAPGVATIPPTDAAPRVPRGLLPESLPLAYDLATKGDNAIARASHKVLLLFSGPYNRPDGLAAYLNAAGLETVLLDNDPVTGAGAAGDICADDVYNALLKRVLAGEFFCIFAAPPCSTFSVSRHFRAMGDADGGPPLVRNRSHIDGLPAVPAAYRRELQQANTIVQRTAAIIMAGYLVGSQYAIENPADRGNTEWKAGFMHADHGPLWLMSAIVRLAEGFDGTTVTFPMCSFEAPWQKITSVMYSPGLTPWLEPLGRLTCEHVRHARVAGGVVGSQGEPSSATSAYPPQFNLYLARAIASLHTPGAPIAKVGAEPEPVAATTVEEADAPAGGADHRTKPAATEQLVAPHTVPEHAAPATPRRLRPRDAPAPDTVASPPVRGVATIDAPPVPFDAGPPVAPFTATKNARGLGRHDLRPRRGAMHRTLGTTGFVALALGSVGALRKCAGGVTSALEQKAGISFDPVTGDAGYAALAKPSSQDPGTQQAAYASNKPVWLASEKVELLNHEVNGSFRWMDRSEFDREHRGRNLLKLVWVYKVKRDGRCKSRLCVQGCRQIKGVDYDQTWCGTLRGPSLRLLSAVAARQGLRMRSRDFVAAYLQGELVEGESVFCLAPSGHATKGSDGRDRVCEVVKPVYGMAQAGRRWQRALFPWLKEQGFTQCHADSSVFVREDAATKQKLVLGCYVDDLCILYDSSAAGSLYASFTKALVERWKVEDEGDLHDLLGIQFDFQGEYLTMRQTVYIEKMCADFFPDGIPDACQAGRTPCDHTLPLQLVDALLQPLEQVDPTLLKRYQSLVGALLYCAGNTRPDVSFAVGLLCRAMSRPTPELYEAGLLPLQPRAAARVVRLRLGSATFDLGLAVYLQPGCGELGLEEADVRGAVVVRS